ncbi:MAG: glycerol kinase GlpK [Clostridia bacterium]|nr:glycerol kinase GlpK [Clostridia bacterium]
MMNKRYLVALDQGTTSSRAVVFTLEGHIVAAVAQEFPQHYPHPGWVEHDPADILSTQIEALRGAVRKAEIDPKEIAAVGITNQRETTFLWDRETGACLHNAIVWQCRRTAPIIEQLIRDGRAGLIREKTGLVPDAYFSGSKIKWLLDTLNLRDRARKGEICFGTADSFLAWHLVEGHPHVTDATNAGRTMLFNLHTQEWDEELLSILDIPRQILPAVVDTAQVVGMLREDLLGERIPVASLVGDQHAALFGQACFSPGDVKNTYGTGCFMLMNAGDEFRLSKCGLLSTMAWRLNGKPTYAFEGSVFMGGAAIQWLRDEMHLISSAQESEPVAASVPDTGGVYLVPAFTGLGAPYWNMYTRGTLVGMTRGTGRAHIVRAALESIAYQSNDLFNAMALDCGAKSAALRVDGGASANKLLMQFQADLMNVPVQRPAVLETTALGAALLAGLAVGIYPTLKDTARGWHVMDSFQPQMDENRRKALLSGWKNAVAGAIYWADMQKNSD